MAKEIQHSVGYGGSNVMTNVMVVQYLLNCVPTARGGPTAELAVDGIIGPKTIAAIRRFQTTNFGRADGRVDPRGRTLQALQAFDPFPNEPVQPSWSRQSAHASGTGSSSGMVFQESWQPRPGRPSRHQPLRVAPGAVRRQAGALSRRHRSARPPARGGGFGGGKWGG